MSKIAIIPARGGSKRIKNKNVRPFLGRPMIAWPIAAARDAGIFERIVVSTDDPEIAEVARGAGAEIPFLRGPELSDDHAGVTEVVRDAIQRLSRDVATDDTVCLLYATAALVRPDDLWAGLRTLDCSGADFAISVTAFLAPIQRALRIDAGLVHMIDDSNLIVRSQDLTPAYHDAGQFCWGSSSTWTQGARIFVAPTAPVVIPSYRVQDIDTEEDWVRAEVLARSLRLTENESKAD